MGKPIQISIPSPCHKDWQQMLPVEKGRFCASCQKKVFDFRQSSDREIAAALKQNKHLCGRFLNTQLNRDLVVPQEKSTLWIAASAAIVSFLTLGSNDVSAQVISTEQRESENDTLAGEVIIPVSNKITGILSDSTGPLPGGSVTNIRTQQTLQTNIDGLYSIEAIRGDELEFSYVGYQTKVITLTSACAEIDVTLIEGLELKNVVYDVYGGIKRRTFFGRVFQSIGNIFRKNE